MIHYKLFLSLLLLSFCHHSSSPTPSYLSCAPSVALDGCLQVFKLSYLDYVYSFQHLSTCLIHTHVFCLLLLTFISFLSRACFLKTSYSMTFIASTLNIEKTVQWQSSLRIPSFKHCQAKLEDDSLRDACSRF